MLLPVECLDSLASGVVLPELVARAWGFVGQHELRLRIRVFRVRHGYRAVDDRVELRIRVAGGGIGDGFGKPSFEDIDCEGRDEDTSDMGTLDIPASMLSETSSRSRPLCLVIKPGIARKGWWASEGERGRGGWGRSWRMARTTENRAYIPWQGAR